jgi:hypothetical protein
MALLLFRYDCLFHISCCNLRLFLDLVIISCHLYDLPANSLDSLAAVRFAPSLLRFLHSRSAASRCAAPSYHRQKWPFSSKEIVRCMSSFALILF